MRDPIIRVEDHPRGADIHDPATGQVITIPTVALARIGRELRVRQPATVDPDAGAWEVAWGTQNCQPALQIRVGSRWLNIPEYLAFPIIEAAVEKIAEAH